MLTGKLCNSHRTGHRNDQFAGQRGNAMIEIIPILTLFVLLINFSIGFFGVVHTGILNSIGARNYAFETLRNRTDVNYLRDVMDIDAGSDPSKYVPYKLMGQRWHTVVDSNATKEFYASRRSIQFIERTAQSNPAGKPLDHNTKVRALKDTGRVSEQSFGGAGSGADQGANPVWIMSAYGICLNANCKQ